MKRFILISLVFAILVFAVDYLLSLLLAEVVPSLQYDRRLERIIEKQDNSDIVITGSSKGARDILAGKMSQELGVTAYNYSYPGSNVDFHEFIISSILENEKKPSLVILILDRDELLASNMINFRLDKLYPLAGHEEIQNIIEEREGTSPSYASFFRTRKFAKSFPKSLYSRFFIERTDTIFENGSMPFRHKSVTYDTMAYETGGRYDRTQEDNYLTSKFESILRLCEKYNINVILVNPPIFGDKLPEFSDRMQEFTNSNVFYFEANDEVFRGKSLFYDQSHLNSKGADVFTQELVDFIRSNPGIMNSLQK